MIESKSVRKLGVQLGEHAVLDVREEAGDEVCSKRRAVLRLDERQDDVLHATPVDIKVLLIGERLVGELGVGA